MQRLYVDNAATSFPKPPGVADAVARYIDGGGGPAGRASYAEARSAAAIIDTARIRLNALLHGDGPDRFAFTLNTTDALNLAIRGVVAAMPDRPHIVTSRAEHNSILRVVSDLELRGQATATRLDPDPATTLLDPDAVAEAIRPDTALVALSHIGNVSGAIQPIAAIASRCRARNVPLLVDLAQSAGHVEIDLVSLGVDIGAIAGHKGLLGPTGTAAIYVRAGVESRIVPLRSGGTGFASESEHHPTQMPARLEAGTPNTAGIAGLSEALRFLLDRGGGVIADHQRLLARRMLDQLRARGCRVGDSARSGPLSALRLLGPAAADHRIAIFSFVHDAVPASDIAMILEERFGILCRAGLHCTPAADAASAARAGTFRMSFGFFNTESDVDRVTEALVELCSGLSGSQPAR